VSPDASLAAGLGPPLPRARPLDRLYLRWDLLPKLDVAAMAAGVEGRCPFLDREVRALAAPPLPRSLGKRALRAAFAKDLPRVVRSGSKRGFGLPLDAWFRTDLPLLDLVLDQRSLERPHLRRDGVRAAVDRHRQGRADLGHALYLLAAMEIHLRCREEAACASAAS
jgi:asparagine synthase (glutamine-hydrolysing)